MLESFRNPFLLGINDSIRLSLNERRNSNWHKDLVLNDNIVPNYSKNDNNNLLNLPKFQINNGNVKYQNRLADIFEDSKEEEIYNVSGLNNIYNTEEAVSIKIESKDSKAELDDNNKFICNLNERNNPLYKSSSFKKVEKNAINEIFAESKNVLNQSYKIKKSIKSKDIRKSANFNQKNSFNEE